jgi:spermidine synthase
MGGRGGLRGRTLLALAAFFVSGFAGLVYEVCWIRMAALVFGSTTHALSTVLAVFFMGIALGSAFFGAKSRTLARPLWVYGWLELGVAACGLLSLPAFALVARVYGSAYRAVGGGGAPLWAAEIGLAALVLLPPTFLMGGTLPLLVQRFVHRRQRIATGVGALYALNTFGAAAGCAIAGLVLIPGVGVRAGVWIAVALSTIAGAAMLFANRETVPAERDAADAPAQDPIPSRVAVATGQTPRTILVGALFFVTGFVALGHEVLWTRYAALLVPNTIQTWTLTLTIVLLGIVFGSLLAARLYDGGLPRARTFGVLQALAAITVLTVVLLPPSFWKGVGDRVGMYTLLFLPAAVLSGALFPLAVRMVVDDPERSGEAVGRMTALNTFGGILGSLAVGFIVLPGPGLQAGFLMTTGLSLAAAVAAWLFLDREAGHVLRFGLAAGAVVIWLAVPQLLRTRVPRDFLATRDVLVDFEEGLESNLAVMRSEGHLVMTMDGWWQGQDEKSHQIMAAHVPMLLHPDPHRVLVVGVGAGQTPARFTLYPIERLDCVDIEPAVFDLIRRHFDARWMDDPRVRLMRADGRTVVAHEAEPYDIVSVEVGQIFRPGVGAFYSRDFYRDVRAHLTPGGIVAQFVPLSFMSIDEFRGIVHTFLDVFPQSAIWYNRAELLLLGVNGPRFTIDPRRLEVLARNEAVRADLEFSLWGGQAQWQNHPDVFLGGFLVGPEGLERIASGGALYRDDRPVLDYQAGTKPLQMSSHEPILETLRAHLTPIESVLDPPVSDSLLAAVHAVRDANVGDMSAWSWVRRANALGWNSAPRELERLLHRALESNPRSVRAMRLLGDVLIRDRREDEAELWLRRAAALDARDALVQRDLGRSLWNQHRRVEAIERYRIAQALRPDDPDTEYLLGAALGESGAREEATRHLRRALELNPGFPAAERALNVLSTMPGRPEP